MFSIETGFSIVNGLPFDAIVYANPIWPQNQAPIDKEKDYDIWIGTRVELPPGTPNVQYVLPPNAQVVNMAGIPPAGTPFVLSPSTNPYASQGTPNPYLPQVLPVTYHNVPPAHQYDPQNAPSAPPDADPPPYSEIKET